MGVNVTERQLHLFKSRKQRGQVSPSEFSLHVTIAALGIARGRVDAFFLPAPAVQGMG